MSLPETERPPIFFHSSRVSWPVLLIRKTRQTFLEVAGRAEECILNELRQLSLLLWVSSRTLHFFFHRWLRGKKKKKGKAQKKSLVSWRTQEICVISKFSFTSSQGSVVTHPGNSTVQTGPHRLSAILLLLQWLPWEDALESLNITENEQKVFISPRK